MQNDTSEASVPLMVVDGSRFEFKEKGIPPEPGYNKSHAHSHSSATINRDDIERAKQNGNPSRGSIDIPEDPSESVAPSGSTSTTMHRMVDGLVASEVSEHHEPSAHFPQISHGESPPTPTADDFEADVYKSSQSAPEATTSAPMESQRNIRPALPSILNSPFAPRPGEASSPHSRPGTAHRHPVLTNTPTPLSSNTRFQEALLRQQQEIEMQPSSLYELPTTSLSQPASSAKNPRFLARDISPAVISSPFASSPSVPSPTFPSYDVPRQVPKQPRFGAVGQIPPSGPGG